MSYSGKPDGQKIAGCFLYVLASALIVGFLAVNAAMGDGPTETEYMSGTTRLLMFPGSLIVAIAGGFLLFRYMTRDED